MGAVFSGFTVIWLIIMVGFFLGRFQLFQAEERVMLSRLAFFVATPCLLFITVSQANFREVLGPHMAIAALSAVATLAIFMVFSLLAFKDRSGGERLIGGMSASLVNGTNLGIPIAAYVLDDIAMAAPVIVFQLAIYTPAYIIALDQFSKKASANQRAANGTGPRVRSKAGASALRSVGQSAGNPMVLGSLLGLLFSWQQWRLPGPVHDSVEIIGGASIPLMLIAFGLSLVGSRPLGRAAGRRGEVLVASAFKLVLHPILAYVCAALIFGLQGHELLAAAVMGGLPAAQNVLVAAIRYSTGEIVARDTVLVTTLLAIPSVILVVLMIA